MARVRSVLAVCLLALLLPTTVLAKKNIHDWQNVVDVDVDTRLAVKVVSGLVYFGYPSKVTADAITLELTLESATLPSGSTSLARTIPKAEIKEIRKAQASRWKSALVGAAIGAGIGGAIGGIGEANAGDYDDKGILTVYLAGLGGVVGAGTGVAKPLGFLKGKKIYQAP